jgi:hypothetical protein
MYKWYMFWYVFSFFCVGIMHSGEYDACDVTLSVFSPRAGGAKRRARVLIPPGYLYPGKRKH